MTQITSRTLHLLLRADALPISQAMEGGARAGIDFRSNQGPDSILLQAACSSAFEIGNSDHSDSEFDTESEGVLD